MRICEITRPWDPRSAGKHLVDRGYENLGDGTHAMVVQKPGSDYVVKFVEYQDRAFRKFYDLVRDSKNPHFPKFIGNLVNVRERNLLAVRMERLFPLEQTPETRKLIIAIKRYWATVAVADLDRWHGDPRIALVEMDGELSSAIELLAKEFKGMGDLGFGNIMRRGDDTIVLADPVAEHAFGGWIHNMKLVPREKDMISLDGYRKNSAG